MDDKEKREMFALVLLHALTSSGMHSENIAHVTACAVAAADILIKALAEAPK